MQVPRHDFRVVEDEGGEVVKISVELPGVTSASEITVRIEPPHIVHVVVPDRYRLLLQLAVPIAAIADSVRFKKKTCKLTMCCRVQASTAQEPAAAEPADEQQQQAPQQQQEAPQQQQQQQRKAGRNRQRQQQQQHNQQQARTVAAVQAAAQQQLRELQEALEESATEGALDMQCQEDQQAQQQQQQQEQQAVLERQRQQEEEQRQEEERLRKEAEDAAAEEETAQTWQLLQQKWQREAEAAAAAELERQVQAEQQRQQEEAAAAAAAAAEKQRQLQAEQQWQQEEAAAAAAEKQRQMQAEQQRQQEEAAVAAAAAAEKHHRLQEQQAPAEAAAAAAAVEKQRQWQAQQRKLQQQQAPAEAAAKLVLREQRAREEREMANMAAAQEWLSRGSTAVSQRNTELASRALSKATELDPSNTWGLQQLGNQLDKLRQQQAAAAASPAALAGRALSSSTSVSSPVSTSSPSSAVSCQTPLADALGRGIAAGSTEGTDDSDKPDKGAQQQQQSTQASESWDGFVTKTVAHLRQSFDSDPLALLERPQNWNLLWWCLTVILALLYGGLRACLKLSCFFLDSTKQEGGGWLWAKTWTVRQALSVPALLFLVMGILCMAPKFLFQYAWTLPLAVAGAFESDTGFPGAESRDRMERLSDASPGELRPGMIKLGLASVSAAVVYGLVWLTCLAQLGGHSLAGWLLVSLLLVWHTVVWVWDFVLWDPPAWYPLQIPAAWLATYMACLDNQLTFITWCMRALFSLQVMLAGGKMVRLCSIAITGLWRYLGFDWMKLAMDAGKKRVPDTAVPAGADVVEHAAAAAAAAATADDPSATTAPKQRLVPLWQCAVLGMSPMIVRSWLLALSYCSFMQQPLAAAADILVSSSVHCAHTLACVLSTVFALKDGVVRTMAFLVGGAWGLFVSCWPVRTLLAAVKLLPLQPLSFLGQAMAALLVAPIKFVAALAYRLAAGVLQIAAWALMGVLTWALPLSVVEPLVEESCAIMGQWRDSCQQLLGPHVSSMASESLSLPHSWWFTVVLQLWLGFLLWRITYWYAHFDELMQQQQAQREKERREAARHKKEQKVQQRRQLRKQGR